MKERWEIQFNNVYETMLGLLEEEACVPGIDNAFADGSFCARQYDAMRDAYGRLCDRLGARDEDADLNAMVDAMEAIQKELCRRMYRLER